MQTTTIDTLSFTGECLVEPMVATIPMDHDIREVAIGFGQQFGPAAVHQDFRASTLGSITFRRVDPLREPFQVADARLQSRLEALCETLRAKY